jgi:hypothetical protein
MDTAMDGERVAAFIATLGSNMVPPKQAERPEAKDGATEDATGLQSSIPKVLPLGMSLRRRLFVAFPLTSVRRAY